MNTQVRDLAANTFDNATRFVVLKLDSISLIVAQQEIEALEPSLDVEPQPSFATNAKQSNAAGVLALATGACPVYALDADLRCLPDIPQRHRICVIFRHYDAQYAVSCAEVHLLPRAALAMHDIPKSLINLKSPVRALVVNDDRLLLGTTAAALYTHVASRAETETAEVISFDARARRLKT